MEIKILNFSSKDTLIVSNKRKNKLDLIKIKNFCVARDTTKKVERQPKNEKMFANRVSGKGTASTIHKNTYNSTIKRTRPTKKWQRK